MTDHFPMLVPDARSDGGELEVKAPYDGSVIATVTAADGGAIERAHANAFSLFGDRTRWLKPSQRIEILAKTAALMSQRAEELAIEAAREGGKPLTDSRVEVARAIDGVKSCIEFLRTEAGDEIPMNLNSASEGRVAFTRREPIGVVVAISAFNHPLNLIVHQVGPAVAVGCPVIVKPAEDTPLSCFRFVQILREASLPEDWCQALVTKDRAAAEALVVDPRVSFLSFIGSARVGWMLRSKLSPHPASKFPSLGLSGLGIHQGYRYGDARLFAAKGLRGHDQRSQRLSRRLDAVCRPGGIGPGGGRHSLHHERHADREAHGPEVGSVVISEKGIKYDVQ